MTLEERVKAVIAQQVWQIITLQHSLEEAVLKIQELEKGEAAPEE